MLESTGPHYHFNTSKKEIIIALDVQFGPNSSNYVSVAAVNRNMRMHHSFD